MKVIIFFCRFWTEFKGCDVRRKDSGSVVSKLMKNKHAVTMLLDRSLPWSMRMRLRVRG